MRLYRKPSAPPAGNPPGSPGTARFSPGELAGKNRRRGTRPLEPTRGNLPRKPTPGNLPAGTDPWEPIPENLPPGTYPGEPTRGNHPARAHRREPIGGNLSPGTPPPGEPTRRPPASGTPGRGWSDPLVCLAGTAPCKRSRNRQKRGGGIKSGKE